MDVREKLVELQLKADIEDEASENTTQHREYIADLMIAHGVTVQEWIPVTERLPKGGAIVLCNTNYFVEVLQWDELANMWVDRHQGYCKNYVTHWTPLPEPPKGE